MQDFMMQTWMAAQLRLAAALDALKERNDERGQTLVEYALILVLIAIVVIVVLTLVGSNVNNVLNKVGVTLGKV